MTQFVGWNASHPALEGTSPGEILVQFGVCDDDENKVKQRFGPQIVQRVLGSVCPEPLWLVCLM